MKFVMNGGLIIGTMDGAVINYFFLIYLYLEC